MSLAQGKQIGVSRNQDIGLGGDKRRQYRRIVRVEWHFDRCSAQIHDLGTDIQLPNEFFYLSIVPAEDAPDLRICERTTNLGELMN